MRLKPKHLGDELTLDEYNAIQHLLFNMTFTDKLYLDPINSIKKNWATYTYQEHSKLAYGKYETFEITNDLATTEQYIKIKLSNEVNGLSTYTGVIYYLESETINNLERLATDSRDVTDELKIPQLNEKRDYKKCNVTCEKETVNGITYLKIPLNGTDDEGNNVTIKDKTTLISRNIELTIHFNNNPYIDTLNGKANQADEILIREISKLEQMLNYHPKDNQKAIYRLDANKTYTPNNTMTIKNGMNIEIRGGTNGGQVTTDTSSRVNIDGTQAGRLFIIQPGGKLVLRDVQLSNANSKNSTYRKGLGGSILIEKDDTGFGQLEAINTIIQNSTSNSGGAIYTEQAGVYLDTCRFTNCTSTDTGGAITYISEAIIIAFTDTRGTRGETITFKVNVKEENGSNVDSGAVHFYIGSNEVGVATVNDGTAQLKYKIPETLTVSEQNVTAIYDGGASNETAYAQASLFIEDPTILTFTMKDITVTEVGTTVTITVISKDQKGNDNTTGTGVFTIDGADYPATVSDGKYTTEFLIPELGYKKEYNITFKVNNMLCTPVSSKITVVESSVFGIFVNNATVDTSLINKWVNNGITDVYVRCNNYSDSSSNSVLLAVLKQIGNKDIRVHAAVNCFYDAKNSRFITPTDERVTWLKENMQKMIEGSNISGIVLDYMRYTGSNPNETDTTKITGYFQQLYQHIKGINKNIIVSASVMPEMDVNSYYYGQDYGKIAPYVDYMMPMAYKGNFNKDDNWVKNVVNYIISVTGSTEKVVPTLQTYTSDTKLAKAKNYKTELRSKADLDTTIKLIANTGCKGVTLFREGLIDTYPTSYKTIKEGS